MDPVTGAFAAKAAVSGAKGLAAFSQARSEKQRAEVNAYIGRTRAIQTDTAARANLDDELGNFRAVAAAQGGGMNVGVLEMMQELRNVRERERRIGSGNRMSEARDWDARARNAGRAGTAALLSGAVGAAPSLFDLYEYRSK